jgi:hypothetical protein
VEGPCPSVMSRLLSQGGVAAAFLVLGLAYVLLPVAHGGAVLGFSDGQRMQLGGVIAGKATVSFDVRNESQHVVRFTKVSGSCTCMDVEFGLGGLRPGEARTCNVNIVVQPKASQSAAIQFDMSAPLDRSDVVVITYHGVQEDTLTITGRRGGQTMSCLVVGWGVFTRAWSWRGGMV